MAVTLDALSTPALVVDGGALEHNLTTMATALPGTRCRPHVKAHKTTALAHRQRAIGHVGFTCATTREMVGLSAAGLGDDLLLANEVVDPEHLASLAGLDARVTIAVDSEATIEAAATAGITECLIDVNVGMPRCGCAPDDAGQLADLARARGLEVRGVMGYEGHVVGVADRARREQETADCMAHLARAHLAVGGEVISAGGTGTFDCNHFATEIQAGSYALMDTAYGQLDLPFRQALFLLATVVSVNTGDGFAVADCGLKSWAWTTARRRSKARRCGSAPTSTRRSRSTRAHSLRSAPACAWCRRTSTRRSRTTSGCTCSTPTRSSTRGPSTSGVGERAGLVSKRGW
jgi:D-serine deaminase-like pyridoxal phosphate-dependent protein